MEQKKTNWLATIAIVCLLALVVVCLVGGWGNDLVKFLDERRSTEAVSPQTTYTDKNGIIRSFADDPSGEEWAGPWDNNLVAEPEAVWGVTPDGDREYPRSDDFETYEDYKAYMDYKYHSNDPEATPPVIHFKDPTAGTAVGHNSDPGPGPYAYPSFGNG